MKAWASCTAASLFFFFVIAQLSIFNAIATPFMAEFSLSAPNFAIIASAFLYANAIALLPAGVIYDRVSTRKIILLMFILTVLATLVFAYSHSVLLDIVCRVVEGVGSAFAFLGTLRLAGKWFDYQKSALVISVMVSFGMLGGVFANAGLDYCLAKFGWRHTLALTAVMGFVFIVLQFFLLRDAPVNDLNPNSSFKQMWQQFLSVATKVHNWLIGSFIGLINLPIMVLASLWGGLYLHHTKHIAMPLATTITSMIFIGEIIGAPVFGWLVQRVGCNFLFKYIGTLATTVLMILIIKSSNNIPLLFISFFSLGFMISVQILGYSLANKINEIHLTSSAQGVICFLINIIGASSQVIFSVVLNTSHEFNMAIWILPIGFLLALFSLFVLNYLLR